MPRAFRRSAANRGSTSRARRATPTRRTACSRWTCCAAPAPASSRPCSARACSTPTATSARTSSARRAQESLAALDARDRALFEAYAEGVNAGDRVAARASVRVPAAAARRPRPGAPRIRSSSSMRCGSTCRDSAARTSSAAAGSRRCCRSRRTASSSSRMRRARRHSTAASCRRCRCRRRRNTTCAGSTARSSSGWTASAKTEHRRSERTSASPRWAATTGRLRGVRAGGGALVANDMHLGLNVPNIWYRARLVVAPAGLDVTGVSLPGVPAIVAGSNRPRRLGIHEQLRRFPGSRAARARAGRTTLTSRPAGRARSSWRTETLEVAGGKPESLVVRKTIWGPVIGDDGEGHELALAWTAHRPGATDMSVMQLERARDLDEAAAIIGGAGMPGQNVMIADTTGRIGWVLSGRLPRRPGIDPLRPSPWNADGAGWDGWLPHAESPRLLDPPQGYRLERKRARRGRRGLCADRRRRLRARGARAPDPRPPRVAPSAHARGHARDPARRPREFAAHWQPILEQALRRAGEAEAARLVAGWSGHAAVDDAGYRLVREFERNVSARAPSKRSRRLPSHAGRIFAGVRRSVSPMSPGASSRRARRTCSTRDSRTGMPGSPTSRRTRPRTCRSNARISRHAPGARSTSPRYATRSARPCLCSPVSRHAGRAPAGRLVHAARAIARFRRVRALQRLARPRERRATCTCPAVRAGTRCRRSIARVMRTGWRGVATPFLPGAAAHVLV